ncbi:MAG: InlB B-repeat-containing protein [Clostridia bacterium]|nr:InlB B-repeat-containing protein [Clostridia bacterium]
MKKLLALLMVALMLSLCAPSGAVPSEEPTRALPIGLDVSAVHAPYLIAGGNPSTTDFLTSDDFASHSLIVINAWDHMCGPCTSEMPYFQQIHEEYSNQGVLVVGVATTWIGGTYPGDYNYFVNHNYNYMLVKLDSVMETAFSYHNFLPQTIFVSPDGVVVDEIAGSTDYTTLKNKVEAWLTAFQHDSYEVNFVDSVTGEIFETQNLVPGSVPVYPDAPVHEGYTFSGWDPATPPVIMGPTTITARYTALIYRVRFMDSITGEQISRVFVHYGESAEAPEPPEHDGYEFVCWDQDFSFVTQSMDVYTIYSPEGGFLPGDADGNGEITSADALAILRYTMGTGTIPEALLPYCDVDGNGSVTSADALAVLRIAMGL